jgi:hypothetical protein
MKQQTQQTQAESNWEDAAIRQSFVTLYPLVTEFLRKEHGFEVEENYDLPHRIAAHFTGTKVELGRYVSTELKTYLALHLFGIAVQLAECSDVAAAEAFMDRSFPSYIDERGEHRSLVLFDHQATGYAAQLLMTMQKEELIPWLTALAGADRLFAEDKFSGSGRKGFPDCRKEAGPSPISPRKIPELSLRQVASRCTK